MDKFNSIVWGDFGAGKTPFCGTLEACPKTSPCLFLDVDQGTMSLDGISPRPTIHTVLKWDEMGMIYNFLQKQDWKGLAGRIETEERAYKSVCIDSGTELAGILLRSIVAEDDRNEGIPHQDP